MILDMPRTRAGAGQAVAIGGRIVALLAKRKPEQTHGIRMPEIRPRHSPKAWKSVNQSSFDAQDRPATVITCRL
jgi:hypothetical protein